MTDVREGSELKAVIPIVKARQIGLIISSLSLLNSLPLPVGPKIGNIFTRNTLLRNTSSQLSPFQVHSLIFRRGEWQVGRWSDSCSNRASMLTMRFQIFSRCIHLGAGLVATMLEWVWRGHQWYTTINRETQDMARLMQRRFGENGAGKLSVFFYSFAPTIQGQKPQFASWALLDIGWMTSLYGWNNRDTNELLERLSIYELAKIWLGKTELSP